MARRVRSALPKVEYLERVDDERKKQIDEFVESVGVKVEDYNLFNRAFSHKSYTNELDYSHNEQSEKLEFFGDGVLGLVINEYLFKVFPDCEEGELAKIKSAVVSEASLAEVAREINLARIILVGRSEMRHGVTRPSLLADILEAFIGAIYIDDGLPAARRFVLRYLESAVKNVSSERSVGDYKSFLQEQVQKRYGQRPVYTVMRSHGPDHSRTFRVSVAFNGRKWGVGEGKSKKEAEQNVAEIAFKAWEEDRPQDTAEDAPVVKSRERSGRGSRGGRGTSRRSAGLESGSRRRRTSSESFDAEATVDETTGETMAATDASSVSDGTAGGTTSRNARGSRGPRRSRSANAASGATDSGDASGGRARRERTPREHTPRSRTFRRDDPTLFAPPSDIDDPVAWAAAEFMPRVATRTPRVERAENRPARPERGERTERSESAASVEEPGAAAPKRRRRGGRGGRGRGGRGNARGARPPSDAPEAE